MDDPVDISALQRLVQRHRAERGLSLRAAAEESEVPFNTLARVEKGHLPDLANFRRIVEWLGLPPERFFEPPRVRTESTPELIAYHLARDPNLSDAAAGRIAALVRDLYDTMAEPAGAVQVHLRAASTFTPQAARALGELLETIQAKLESRSGGAPSAEDR
ncbi:helix-turn-helix domain protein [Catenulispora acidiphila DSM 44928]|uniref:Helix-turn-helix domain protein n=1 Tax=Catenulispora acidiphila (strain DSM 44928 / JCM 14897 / NBRC 102108 / NRRL B-24433 / ID139908) TaxID=479433 RepID=C7Q3J8_CATAD|nr:helix-turn-helix transcriptional regulator [Catenulispora acidiphila]ACU75763.1 helix-turn-helix domain protein [Catenulispora acidiphila DSM 44928]